MRVWLGSYGFREAEPLASFAAAIDRYTFDHFVSLLEDVALEDAEWMYDSADWGEVSLEEFTADLVFYYTDKPEEFEPCAEHREELEKFGYTVIGEDCGCRVG